MESIPGWRADLDAARLVSQLRSVGAVIGAAGDGLAPADRKLYALRDVTGTVESIPLIASSIMSKKLAEGAEALVLDVKVGAGAFLPRLDDARELATTMVELGAARGLRTVALLTAMDQPLGRAVGNALEVAEAVECLAGGGPPDVVEVTVALARTMLELAGPRGLVGDPADVLAGGGAMDSWRAMVAAQGGDPDAPLPRAAVVDIVGAPASGVVTRLDARAVGIAAWRLGAGRARKEDPVSAAAGVVCRAKVGEPVQKGEPLLELHTDDPARLAGRARRTRRCRRHRGAAGRRGRDATARPRADRPRPGRFRPPQPPVASPAWSCLDRRSTSSGGHRRSCSTTTSTAGCDPRP